MTAPIDTETKALDLINLIGWQLEDTSHTLTDVKNVLEDGKALAGLGIYDQETVEEAHAIVDGWMEKDYAYMLICERQ